MADFPATSNPTVLDVRGVISTFSGPYTDAARLTTATASSIAWAVANRAVYVPIHVEKTATVYQIGWENGTTVAGTNHVDVGIYGPYPSWTRIVSAGSTVLTGVSSMQVANITDTVLTPGVYWLAMALDTTTDHIRGFNTATLQWLPFVGVGDQTSAFALPNPAVPVFPPGNAIVPDIFALTAAT